MFRPPVVPPLTLQQCQTRARGPAPRLIRRMAAFAYEGVLLFGVVMLVGLAYGVMTDQRHGLAGRTGLMASLFLALTAYFLWFWLKGGQTLAMKTWFLKLVDHHGQALRPWQALARALMAWLWFLPPIVMAWLAQWHTTRSILGLMAVWVLLYALSSLLLPQRQFLHDLVCRTRLIDTRP